MLLGSSALEPSSLTQKFLHRTLVGTFFKNERAHQMKQKWTHRELEESWMLSTAELKLLDDVSHKNRLGFALLLKFFQIEGHFPESKKEIPQACAAFIAEQLESPVELFFAFFKYGWDDRTSRHRRAEIRNFCGYREATTNDTKQISDWLVENYISSGANEQQIQAAAYQRLKELKIEPPERARIDRLVRSARKRHEAQVFETIARAITKRVRKRLDALIEIDEDEDENENEQQINFTQLRQGPGGANLKSILHELDKLDCLKALALSFKSIRRYQPRHGHKVGSKSRLRGICMPRTNPQKKARQLAKYLRDEQPDYQYLKTVFRHLRTELDVPVLKISKKLPQLPTEDELKIYYETVWQADNSQDLLIIKTLLYTGARVSELVNIKLTDVDFKRCQIRIDGGKGDKDRIVPFPEPFKELLAFHSKALKAEGATYLFESTWKKNYTDRGIRKILERYALAAGLDKSISPHMLRHFLFTWLKKQGIDDALIQPYSGHASRKSLEVYSNLSLTDAQTEYNQAIRRFPV